MVYILLYGKRDKTVRTYNAISYNPETHRDTTTVVTEAVDHFQKIRHQPPGAKRDDGGNPRQTVRWAAQ